LSLFSLENPLTATFTTTNCHAHLTLKNGHS
jgi:hypothetical protein